MPICLGRIPPNDWIHFRYRAQRRIVRIPNRHTGFEECFALEAVLVTSTGETGLVPQAQARSQ